MLSMSSKSISTDSPSSESEVFRSAESIVFGAAIEETGNLGKSRIAIPAREVVSKSPANVEIVEAVLRDECLDLYREA